jgi:hypothetical protein
MKAKTALTLLICAATLAGCRLAPYDAQTERDLSALEAAHLAMIDTCAVMETLDGPGQEAGKALWLEAYQEAMRHQGRLVDNDDLRRETFGTAKSHFDQASSMLETADYPLSPAYANNLRDHARVTYRHLIDGERGRKGSLDNP